MKKNETINYLRCIAAIFVVYIHSANIFGYMNINNEYIKSNLLIYLFNTAVPIFFLISGYLTFIKKDINYKNHYKKKLKTLVLPYVIWIILYFVFNLLLSILKLDSSIQNSNFFNLFIGIPFCTGPGLYVPLWFLRDLILLNLFVPILDKLLKITNYKLILIILCVLICMPIPYYLYQSLFFVLGGLIARNEKLKSLIHIKVNLIIILTISLIISIVQYDFKELEILSRINMIVYIYLVYLVTRKTIKYNLSKIFIRLLTPFSFWVYLTHGKLLSVLQIIISKIAYENILVACLGFFILPIITIFICLIIGKIIKKLMPNIFDIMLGNRT